MTSDSARLEREVKMFGCSISTIRVALANGKDFGQDATAVAISMLSDAQEEIAMGDPERARQTINRAKWILSQK